VALIHRALYGEKSAELDFRNHLRSCMHHIGFKSSPADPDVWMRAAVLRSCMHYIGFKSCPANPDVWIRSAIKSDATDMYE
jgi:hypothetical protein